MMDNMEVFSWINSWLSQGEQILWRGKPERYSLLNKKDSLMIPFSIAWCGFAIFWELSVIITGAPLLFRLWGIPFVCVGLYMVFGRFLYRRYQLRHSTYVITNRKIIRKVGGKIDMLQSFALPPMEVEQREDGSGTIHFSTEKEMRPGVFSFLLDSDGFSLVGLSDVRRAMNAIDSMRSDNG